VQSVIAEHMRREIRRAEDFREGLVADAEAPGVGAEGGHHGARTALELANEPNRFLSTIHERINPGGLLVITSPYTWLEEYTKKEEWLGGYKESGENVTTLDGLTASLAPRFRMLGEPREVPFVIRETRRKFQHTLAEMTVWELKR
jgi:hypothetical protein